MDADKGDPACTHYLQKCWHPKTFYPATLSVPQDGLSLVQLQLETGRTHQIRAHLSSTGHPIIGDSKYGNPKVNSIFRKKYALKYQLLHAWKMQFPKREDALAKVSEKELTAPLPEGFTTIIKGEGLEWEPGIQEG